MYKSNKINDNIEDDNYGDDDRDNYDIVIVVMLFRLLFCTTLR